METQALVIGGGLAGAKATWQAAAQHTDRLAGQLAGMEGYLGNIAAGLLEGRNAARLAQGAPVPELPAKTMLGTLMRHVTSADRRFFQPMQANLGLLPSLGARALEAHKERAVQLSHRAKLALGAPLGNSDGQQCA